MTEQGESFWSSVYAMYMARDITRTDLRDVIRRGLEQTRGNYKVVAELFNLEPARLQALHEFLEEA